MGAKAREAKARQRAQAEAVTPLFVEWEGETFELAPKIGAMPFMRFAKIAEAGTDSDELAGQVAIYDLLSNCLTEESWVKFEQHAMKIRATGDELMTLIQLTVAAKAGRPTVRPSDSSVGPSETSGKSNAVTDPKLQRVLDGLDITDAEGTVHQRPDLKLLVWRQNQEMLAATG